MPQTSHFLAIPGNISHLRPVLIRRGPRLLLQPGKVGRAKGRSHHLFVAAGSHLLSPSTGTSSSASPPTWAACALPTLMLPPRSLSKDPSSGSGPVRNGPSSVSPTYPSCAPARSHQSRPHDGKAGAGFEAYVSSCAGLHLPAKTAGSFSELGVGSVFLLLLSFFKFYSLGL